MSESALGTEHACTNSTGIDTDLSRTSSIWLVELSRILKPSAHLDGLDVSHAQCPPADFMPKNVHLRIHDCLSEPPSDLLEQYDIIHLQFFNSVIPDNDPVPVVLKMLKLLS